MFASLRCPRPSPSRPAAAVCIVWTREFANRAKKMVKKETFEPTRGWTRIQEKLAAVPLRLPELQSLNVTFGRNGDGHTAARHFVRQHLAQLRFQNPEAEVTQRNSKEAARSLVSLTLAGAEPLELDVTGLAHRTDVLRRVLEAVRVGEAELQAALVAAEAQSDVTIDSEGYDDKRPVKVHGVPPRVVNPLPTKRAHPVERE